MSVKKVQPAPGHPYNGSYEIVFLDADYDNLNVPKGSSKRKELVRR